MALKNVVQLGLVVEVEVVVEDVLQAVPVCLVAVEATSQFVLTTCEPFHEVQLTHVSVFLKQRPQ